MSRFARIVLCIAAVAACLAVLSPVSMGQTGSQPKTFGTRPPKANTTASSQATPNLIPEGTVTIYSDFGPGYSYFPTGGYETDSEEPVAMGFTPTQGTYLLTQIDLAVVWLGGSQNSFKLELRDDWKGEPDPAPPMASWHVKGVVQYVGEGPCYVKTIQVKQLIVLQKNHRYWLVMVPDPDAYLGWNGNYDEIGGWLAQSDNAGLTWDVYYDWLGAFDVLGKKLF